MLPLVLSRQKEYYDIIKTIKELETGFDVNKAEKHLELADKYYAENKYHLALFEYENCVILDHNLAAEYENIIQKIKRFLDPETRIIKTCFEKGALYHSEGDFSKSNKYFTKIMTLADENSSEYKLAKSRIVNV
jgi:tetratricopeptide (TPR) repeat protein